MNVQIRKDKGMVRVKTQQWTRWLTKGMVIRMRDMSPESPPPDEGKTPKDYMPALETYLRCIDLHGHEHKNTKRAEGRYRRLMDRYCAARNAENIKPPRSFMKWI